MLSQPAHVRLHVEAVHGVGDRAGAQEQAGLEEGVGEQVEDGRRPRTHPERHDHVAQLRDRGVGQHLLDVALHEGHAGSDDGGEAADEGHQVDRAAADLEALEEDAVHTGDHEDAGHDHGGCVDERRNRRRAGHGVRQPGVEEELT